MRIGILGPVSTKELAHLLDADVGDLPPGNGGYPVTLLVRELVDAGHDVRVWTLDPAVAGRIDAGGPDLHISYLPYRPDGRGRDAYAPERRWLADAMVGERVDVLNPHWSYEYALAALPRPEPLVLTVHDWAPAVLRYHRDAYRAVRLGMFAAVHARRPQMTTPSPYLQRKLARSRLGRAVVVPNGVAEDAFAPGPRPRGAGMAVLSVSMGFTRLKNTATLVLAIRDLRRAGVPVTLTLVGTDHEPGGPTERFARSVGLPDGVIELVGVLPYDEVVGRMRRADVFVHPAREESFGMVLAEAMSQGTPVVAGRRSGAVPWVLDEGRAGVLVDVDRPDEIAQAVQRLLQDPAHWEATAAAGYRNARDRFGMQVVRDGYLAAYDRVLAR